MIAKLLPRFLPHLGIAALLTIAALSAGLAFTRDKLADVRKDLTLEQAFHARDVANFKAGQADANAKHLAEVGALKDNYWRLQNEADQRAIATRDDYLARVLRLPAAPRANQSSAVNPAVPGADLASSPLGPSSDSVLLARSDALICATNTARLEAAHLWALGLAGPKP